MSTPEKLKERFVARSLFMMW